MVKQAEKVRKRNPWLPVIGLVIAIVLFGIAYILEDPLATVVRQRFPDSGFALANPKFEVIPADPAVPNSSIKIIFPSWPRIGIAFAIWLLLLAIAYALVAVLAGKDPNSAKNMQLPPRTKEEKRRRY